MSDVQAMAVLLEHDIMTTGVEAVTLPHEYDITTTAERVALICSESNLPGWLELKLLIVAGNATLILLVRFEKPEQLNFSSFFLSMKCRSKLFDKLYFFSHDSMIELCSEDSFAMFLLHYGQVRKAGHAVRIHAPKYIWNAARPETIIVYIMQKIFVEESCLRCTGEPTVSFISAPCGHAYLCLACGLDAEAQGMIETCWVCRAKVNCFYIV